MYKQSGDEGSFFKLKPKLSGRQQELLSGFYRLSQERVLENGSPLPIKDKEVYYFYGVNGSQYPRDLFLTAIHLLDSYYIEQRCEEIRKANKV